MNQVKVTERVQKQLFELQDLQYRDFQAKLLPTIEKETVIGVRMPVLRKFAKGYGKTEEAKEFLKILPHQYYDENNLHGLLIEQIKDYDRCLAELERFLPYIDNWATCDMLAVKVMKKSSGYIYRRDLPLDEIRPHLYNPIWYRYADALLSGRRIPDRISQESSFGSVRRILCEYDAGMVFCNRARKAI